MKTTRSIIALIILANLTGCAYTEVKNKNTGKREFYTQADATSIDYQTKDVHLVIIGHKPSVNTRAGGSVLGTGFSGLTSAIVAWLTHGVAK